MTAFEPPSNLANSYLNSTGRPRMSLRDLVEIMAERGLAVAHTTIMHWVQRFVPEFERRWNQFARQSGQS
jgi:transposase-like protein